MYLIIGGWGGERRVYAAVKFFLFTMAGSAFLLVAILFLYFRADPNTFDLAELQGLAAAGGHRAVAVPGVLRGLRSEGPAVPAAHVAARRAHRGPHGRIGDPGRASC